MHSFIRVLDSSIGQKAVAAATGLGLLGFVVVHMAGNLQIFLGPDALNAYAVKLKSLGALLWAARIGLLALVTLHLIMTYRAYRRSREARGGRYHNPQYQASTSASRNMAISGSVILAFVIFHLLHFTFGVVQPESYEQVDAEGRHDVYAMVIAGFESWPIAIFYLVAMTFLFSHISHASYSALRTLGLSRMRDDSRLKTAAWWIAAATIVGFAALPLAVLTGWLT